jgi:hypothetical protein
MVRNWAGKQPESAINKLVGIRVGLGRGRAFNSREYLDSALIEAGDLGTRYLCIIAIVAIDTTSFLHVKLSLP